MYYSQAKICLSGQNVLILRFCILLKWIEDTSQFNEDFKKNYNEESDGYF